MHLPVTSAFKEGSVFVTSTDMLIPVHLVISYP